MGAIVAHEDRQWRFRIPPIAAAALAARPPARLDLRGVGAPARDDQRSEMLMRGPARTTLGTACSQSRWQCPPMNPTRSEQERPRRSERDDRHQRVVEVTQLAIAVPRHAVAPVPVVVQEHPTQWYRTAFDERGPHCR